jgi:hypothetical protein
VHIEKIKFFGEKGFCGYDFHIRYRFNRSSQSLNLVLQIHHSCDIRESVLSTYGEFVLTNLSSLSRNKSSVFLLVLALIVGGVGAQATGLLNTSSGGYLVCVNSKTKVVTHPGTSSCPKGSKKLVLGAQGAAGTNGLTGATGLSGRDGSDGKDGKTLWNGVKDPESTWGAPGDMFINSVTKTLFGPKDFTTGWPAGVSMVGPQGAQGPIGLTGPAGPQGPGGSGPAGATGATGANGTNATIAITELFVCDGTDEGTVADEKCKIGMTGPGGGLIFFVDYNDQYAGFNYLEAALSSCEATKVWSSVNTSVPAVAGWAARAVGAGSTNTAAMKAAFPSDGSTNNAAHYAASCTAGSKSDWFLGSLGEMKLMYDNLQGLGGFVGNYYWSSSEYVAGTVWSQDFLVGSQSATNKNNSNYVRPVRAF